jgi:hypothetical protein
MKNFYELEIELPVMDKPGRWKLDVVDEHGHKLNDVSVIYPHELALCTSAFTPR